jgi:ABC-type transport system substrate-binding protein
MGSIWHWLYRYKGLWLVHITPLLLWSSAAIPAEPKLGGTLKVITQNDLKVLDPFWTTAYISRNHGYMIYDVLFALDANLNVQPQMVDTWEISPDRLQYTFTLRDGLQWHDERPVTSADVIASLKRWGQRDGQGKLLMQATESLEVINDKSFRLVLKGPFGLVLEALAKPSSNVPFIMPARVAATPAHEQVRETIGSGPFRFVKDEWQPGHRVVYVRNPTYVPRSELRATQLCGWGEACVCGSGRMALYPGSRHGERSPGSRRGRLLGKCASRLCGAFGKKPRPTASRRRSAWFAGADTTEPLAPAV